MELISGWWERILVGFIRAIPPEVGLTELAIILAFAAALSIPRATWRYFGLFTTVVHELGHAFAAVMTGRRLTGIRLNLDHSGTTTSLGQRGWRTVWSGFWGYPVPAVTGAALVWAGFNGWGPAAMSLGALILVAALLFIRNGTGLLIILGAAAVAMAIVLAVPAEFTGHVVIALGAALLVGSVRDLVKVATVHIRRRRELHSSDANILYRATGVPSAVWLFLFTVVIAGSWLLAWLSATPTL
ncbi:M50 family metallopeptidase [Arthrobacter sp. H5]|uniref:M50 family metallopeptidase n=1 Tax=Arthrobacter sp. H5 TaxID=1267973 RepID=UPI0004B6C3DC|nr:M50 family metallopeptidase [Arthrobacter sp. H5]